MSTFRLHANGVIYLYQWLTPTRPFKFSTGLKIEKKKWNKEKMRPRTAAYNYKGINVTQELTRIESAFQEAWNYFKTNGGLTSIKLKNKFKEKLSAEPDSLNRNDKPRFLDFFAQTILQYKVANKNNWEGYTTTLNRLKSFFGTDKPEFEDIDSSFYLKFNEYLIELDLSVNTISNQWKHIKAIMKQAQQLKYHNNIDFHSFKRSQEESDAIYLSLSELENLYKLDLTGHLAKARDYFIIGAYTGLRFSDWDRVSLARIKSDVLSIRSAKTGELSIIRIHPKVLKTLQKYPDGVLPVKPSNQKMNEYIKKIALKAKITEPIETRITKGGIRTIETSPKYKLVSTHTARRSFATNMVLTGASPYLIMAVTGHKSITSFEKYVRFNDLQATDKLKDSVFFNPTEIADEEAATKLTEKEKKKLLLLP